MVREGDLGTLLSPSPGGNPYAARVWEAPPEGLEPPTGGLEVHCSIQLSYGGKGATEL